MIPTTTVPRPACAPREADLLDTLGQDWFDEQFATLVRELEAAADVPPHTLRTHPPDDGPRGPHPSRPAPSGRESEKADGRSARRIGAWERSPPGTGTV